MALNRDNILKISDRRPKLITVPEWGEVYIRKLSAAEMEQWEDFHKSQEKEDQKRMINIARYVCLILCDDQAQPLFKSFDVNGKFVDDDAAVLVTKAHDVLFDLLGACTEYNKPKKEDTEKN
jgi:hypothetical protein